MTSDGTSHCVDTHSQPDAFPSLTAFEISSLWLKGAFPKKFASYVIHCDRYVERSFVPLYPPVVVSVSFM